MSQLAKPAAKEYTLAEVLASSWMKDQLLKVLPKHCDPERFMAISLQCVRKTPKLAQCTQTSVMNCLRQLSQLGLEPDGRRAHLIPFGTECTLVIDYKGLVELAMRAGTVSSIHADTVCENDVFEYDMGEIVHHKVDFRKPRGAAFAYYTIVKMRDGGKSSMVISLAEAQAIRDKSQGWTAFKSGRAKSSPWADYPDEQGKKTAFKRHSKWLVLSPELRDAVEIDDATEGSVIETTAVPSLPANGSKSDMLAAMMGAVPEEHVNDARGEESQVAPEVSIPVPGAADHLEGIDQALGDCDSLRAILGVEASYRDGATARELGILADKVAEARARIQKQA